MNPVPLAQSQPPAMSSGGLPPAQTGFMSISHPQVTGTAKQTASAKTPAQLDAERSEHALVKQWTEKIKNAKKLRAQDHQRMLDNMEFAAGYQWVGQDSLSGSQYVSNITLRNISQKVSTLYARDPQAVPRRRERMNYQLWDEKMESLQQAFQAVMMAQQQSQMLSQAAGQPLQIPPPPEAIALMQDYQQGRQWEEQLDKVAKTMKILYHYQMDEQTPSFKEQLKQLVAYVCTCGVGFARMSFTRNNSSPIGTTSTIGTLSDRVKRIRALAEQSERENMDGSNPVHEQIRMLANSLVGGIESNEQGDVQEKIIWDFPSPLSIIVDPACKALMEFIGAKWIVQEYVVPVTTINDYFELRGDNAITETSDMKRYDSSGKEQPAEEGANNDGGTVDKTAKPLACLWEVFDLRNKSRFFLVDGYKCYVQAPDEGEPLCKTRAFYPIHSLTFNRIVSEPGCKASIYPPSDVDLMRPMQKEWNRSRQELRGQRKANAPMYCVPKNVLTTADIEKIQSAQPNAVIELGGVPPGTDLKTVIQPFPVREIDPALYDTAPLLQDVNLTIGNQAADLGQQQKGDTATGQQISEQSRMTTTSSNVDDLDGFLSRMARQGGEILLREMSPDTVKRIVGRGAVWPGPNEREDFLNSLYLETEAASSGRPNKAIELANWRQIAPVLQASGASPAYIVRESIKRLDDRAEPAEAFPLVPTQPNQPPPANGPQPSSQAGGPQPQAGNPQQPTH